MTNSETKLYTFQDILRISTIFGFSVLIFDFLQLSIAPDSLLSNNLLWDNLRYLLWAVGVFYSLQWFHLRNPKTPFLKYLWFIEQIAFFVSLFDIFFSLLYFNVINPEAKGKFLELIYQANPNIEAMGESAKEVLTNNFNFVFAMGQMLSYIFLFLFFSVFYVLFLKLFVKPKNK